MAPAEAVQTLYATPGLFDQLRDSEASAMLSWAETQVARIASQPAADFDGAFDKLCQLAGSVNRLVGLRHEMTFEAHQAEMQTLLQSAAAIGLEPLPLAAPVSAQTDQDDSAVLQGLLGMLTPAAPGSPTNQPQIVDHTDSSIDDQSFSI